VEVGTADSAGKDAQEEMAGGEGGARNVFDAEGGLAGAEDGGFHGGLAWGHGGFDAGLGWWVLFWCGRA
jgi:hypothetical protein